MLLAGFAGFAFEQLTLEEQLESPPADLPATKMWLAPRFEAQLPPVKLPAPKSLLELRSTIRQPPVNLPTIKSPLELRPEVRPSPGDLLATVSPLGLRHEALQLHAGLTAAQSSPQMQFEAPQSPGGLPPLLPAQLSKASPFVVAGDSTTSVPTKKAIERNLEVSTPPAAKMCFHPSLGNSIITLQGRCEQGYTFFRMRLLSKSRLAFNPSGTVMLFFDSGAQVSVMGIAYAHLLTHRGPPPPGLKLYEALLACIEFGTMSLMLGTIDGIPGEVSRHLVPNVRVAPFRVGMVTAAWDTTPVARSLLEIRQVASLLANFDWATFRLLPLTSEDLQVSADPLMYFGYLDNDGFIESVIAQTSENPPFFELGHGGAPTFGYNFGLAHPARHVAVMLPLASSAPSPSLAFADLPGLVDADSADEDLVVVSKASTTAALLASSAGDLTVALDAPPAAALHAPSAGSWFQVGHWCHGCCIPALADCSVPSCQRRHVSV